MTYIFYDTETTGTKTAFDQILQFAAIQTDDDFNELDRIDIRCRLLPYVVPSPGALRATMVTPSMLTDPTLPSHYEAIRQIRAKLIEWSPATFIGYNNIEFDENILRQAFFQTLHSPYLTNTNGNGRSDVMRAAHAVSVYAPDSITIPTDDKGRATFRLDHLAPANGYVHDHAHEAVADVLATIHIARLVRDREPGIWQAIDSATTKTAVKDYVSSHSMFSLTERYFGKTYNWIVSPCGQNPEYDGQFAVFDLYYDPDEYRSLSVEELVAVLNATPKVIRSLRASRQPIMMPPDAAPRDAKAHQISADERRRRVSVIRNDLDFQSRVGHAQSLRFANEEPSPHVEEQINDGFLSPADQALMERFHAIDWAERAALATRIDDARVREFADRLIFCEHSELLPDSRRAELNAWRAARIATEDESVPWMTIKKALRETSDLLQNASGPQAELLQEVKDFLLELGAQAESG